MNEFLEIMSLMMGRTETENMFSVNSSFDSVDPCSFFEFSIIFPILQSLENWDTGIPAPGIPSFSFSFLANYVTLIFFCYSVDFQ